MTRSPKRIMIVDDDREFLEEMADLLESSGYETIVFEDGRDAERALTAERPDLILLDLDLPGKSGFVIATEVTRDPETADIPIVAMSGRYTGTGHAVLSAICGSERMLTKPLNPLDVIWAIERAFETKENE